MPWRLPPRPHAAREAVGQRDIDGGIRSGRSLCTARGTAESEAPEVPVDFATRQRLPHKVRRVFRAEDLVQTASLGPNEVLHPKLCNCEVAHLADAAPVADFDGCCAVRVDLGSQFDPRSRATLCNPSTSLKPRTTAPSSASPELRVIFFCVLAQCLSKWVPSSAAPPDVLSREVTQPAKSESLNARNTGARCHGYSYTSRGAPTR